MTTDTTATYADVDQAFTTREVPWMKMGKITDEPATAAEAAKLGGLDFDVRLEPLYFATKQSNNLPRYTKIPKRMAVVANDTDEWLSVVGAAYPIVQYREAFDFMDSLGAQHYVAAGTLRKRHQGFIVVKLDEMNITPFADDPHNLYAVLRTSHDCSRAVEVMVMPLRDRCMNQLTLRSFTKGVEHRWSITHTGNVKQKLEQAKMTMTMLHEYAGAFASNAQRLASIKVDHDGAEQVLKRVLPNRPKRDEVVAAILDGWTKRDETVGFPGTGWGLVNAVSEYFEWDRKGGTAESRFLAALQGQTHNAINKTAAAVLSRN